MEKVENLPNEIWKPSLEFGGKYMVSSMGRVKTVLLTGKTCKGTKIWTKPVDRLKRVKADKGGYYRVHVSLEGQDKYRFVHRLVYEAFNGAIPKNMQINHKDYNPANNSIDNLELVTPKQNLDYSFHHRSKACSLNNKKKRKLTPEQVRSIRNAYERGGVYMWQLAKEYGVNRTTISSVVNYKLYKDVL